MQPAHNILDFLAACDVGQSQVLVQYQATKSARDQFGIKTNEDLLAFIGQGELKKRKYLDSEGWRFQPESEPPVVIDAFEFTTGNRLGYLAFGFLSRKGKWVLKSFHLQTVQRRFEPDEDQRRIELGKKQRLAEEVMPETKLAQISCPVCDSDNVKVRTEKRVIGDIFSGRIEIDEHIYNCENCGYEGDFTNKNDQIYKDAMEQLSKAAVANVFAQLTVIGLSNAHVERTLQLPQRTAARWKKDGASAAATSLMKCVATYPWILEVSEREFDPFFAKQILLREAGTAIASALSDGRWSANFIGHPDEQQITVTLKKDSMVSAKSTYDLSQVDEQLALVA